MTDWQAWHGDYDDQDSSLSRRLRVVQQRLTEVVSAATGMRRILSLCSGDGRDIVPVVARLPHERRPAVVLVELDRSLAVAAEQRARDVGVAAKVVVGDAGLAATWQDVVPVDLLMLCGIFGNISDADVRATINAARGLLTSEGTVIWTRGYFSDHDLRPQVRAWFTAAGFTEIAFDAEPTGYGVGVNQLASAPDATLVPERLFTFVR